MSFRSDSGGSNTVLPPVAGGRCEEEEEGGAHCCSDGDHQPFGDSLDSAAPPLDLQAGERQQWLQALQNMCPKCCSYGNKNNSTAKKNEMASGARDPSHTRTRSVTAVYHVSHQRHDESHYGCYAANRNCAIHTLHLAFSDVIILAMEPEPADAHNSRSETKIRQR